MPIYREVDRGFFKKWSPEMAYVLGFFAADGTMIANNRGAHFIEFHITDKQILVNIRRLLKSNHKIATRDRGNKKWKIGYRLQIGSKEIFEDLTSFGFTPNKSLTIKFPDIPTNLLGDFVRGYFDGDGCVYFKRHFAKDRNKYRWFFTTVFTCGSKVFLKGLHQNLSNYLNGGSLRSKTGGYELVFSRRDSVALYNLMYHNNCRGLYLNRKHKLFRKALRTLYGIR